MFSLALLLCPTATCVLYNTTEHSQAFFICYKLQHGLTVLFSFQGVAGTDISKEACDVILLNDDFNSIVNAIKWGRHIYHTILKFLQFQFTVCWVAVIIVLVGAVIVGVSKICYLSHWLSVASGGLRK